MRTTAVHILCSALAPLLLCAGPVAGAAAPESDELTPFEGDALATLAALDRSDRAHPASDIWPGYRFSERPILVYFPDRWAVLLHATHVPVSFVPYPAGWPAAGPGRALYRGTFGHLVGQLDFDVPLDGGRVAAIPLTPAQFPPAADSAAVACLAFVAHEAFHQYQHDRFASIETGLEERYPIEDAGNAALVAVEMRILSEALRATEQSHARAMMSALEDFLAVRAYRWSRAGAQTAELERQQELIEGTAKYVEARAVALVAWHGGEDAADSLERAMAAPLGRVTATGHIRQELALRLGRDAVALEDLPRNRVYGLGAAQAILLDVLWVDWKRPAQDSSGTFAYARLLERAIGRTRLGTWAAVARVLHRHGHAALLRASRRQVGEHRAGYWAARREFEAQAGLRMRVTLPTGRLSRSRSSRARRWIVDRGARTLSSHYIAYTLTDSGTRGASLRIREAAVLEEEYPREARKTVSFFAPALDSLTIDGRPTPVRDGTQPFQTAGLSGTNFTIRFDRPGTVRIAGRSVSVDPVTAPR